MKRVCWLHGIGGASGDMLLAALTQLGISPEEIETALRPLDLGPWHIEVEDATDRGIRGRRLRVIVGDSATPRPRSAPGTPAHGAEHGHSHLAGSVPGHPHRAYRDIRAMIERSALPPRTRELGLDAFRRLAEAEAKIHGIAPDAVMFHELGAVDSIVDILGACFARDRLGLDGVFVEPLPIGGGTVHCAHGVYPLPAPATLELLRGWPVAPTSETEELVTPTGAALLRSWANLDRLPEGLRLLTTAYGLGHRALRERPNALRATILETAPAAAPAEECRVLECNLDDQTPELIGVLTGRLLAAGALDVFTTPVTMKKQRPGVLLTVLCREEQRDGLLDLIFRESTTFGVRERRSRRHVLERAHETVETPYGPVRIKVGRWRGAATTRAPEMDDCIARAAERGVSPRTVYDAALAATHRNA